MNASSASRAICGRAHDGLIRARAQRLVEGSRAADKVVVPLWFWWARGARALTQNWATGDFETWINNTTHVKAYGVEFARADVEKLLPEISEVIAPSSRTTAAPSADKKGGRPPADWWEDLLIELCFKHFHGDLKPKTQAEVQLAMQEWIEHQGYNAAESTVRIRARKLWKAICRDSEN